MKNKTIVKIFTIAVLFVILASSVSAVVGFAGAQTDVDGLIKDQSKGQKSDTADKVNTAANVIIGVVQIVGVAVAVIMLIWLGVKYVSASPQEKGDIKKGAAIYVVGAAFILSATGILQLIKTTVTNDIDGVINPLG